MEGFTDKMKRFIVFLFLIIFVSQKDAQEKGLFDGNFIVGGKITGFRPGYAVYIALYDNQENFKKQKFTNALRITADKCGSGRLEYALHQIKKGEYMIVAYQDMNGDGNINTNFLGIPSEPYCIYRKDASVRWPDFRKCRFTIDRNISGADLNFSNSR